MRVERNDSVEPVRNSQKCAGSSHNWMKWLASPHQPSRAYRIIVLVLLPVDLEFQSRNGVAFIRTCHMYRDNGVTRRCQSNSSIYSPFMQGLTMMVHRSQWMFNTQQKTLGLVAPESVKLMLRNGTLIPAFSFCHRLVVGSNHCSAEQFEQMVNPAGIEMCFTKY